MEMLGQSSMLVSDLGLREGVPIEMATRTRWVRRVGSNKQCEGMIARPDTQLSAKRSRPDFMWPALSHRGRFGISTKNGSDS